MRAIPFEMLRGAEWKILSIKVTGREAQEAHLRAISQDFDGKFMTFAEISFHQKVIDFCQISWKSIKSLKLRSSEPPGLLYTGIIIEDVNTSTFTIINDGPIRPLSTHFSPPSPLSISNGIALRLIIYLYNLAFKTAYARKTYNDEASK